MKLSIYLYWPYYYIYYLYYYLYHHYYPASFLILDYAPPLNDYSAFVNEWLEIEFQGCSFLWNDEPVPTHVPNFLRDSTPPQSWTKYCKNSE